MARAARFGNAGENGAGEALAGRSPAPHQVMTQNRVKPMSIHIIEEEKPYRLISDGEGRYAVIEARAGHVYSLHCRQRNGALDSPAGMAVVVGDGWGDETPARQLFRDMCGREEGYSQIIW